MQQRMFALGVIVVVVSIPWNAAGQEFVGPVGQWGDPARIHIEGARKLDPQTVKQGLVGDFQHFMVSHPSAPLAGLAKSIQKHLLRGYQRAGFGEARVDVRLDFETRQVMVQIDEGQRWRAGAIRVEGPPKVRDLLTKLLANPRAPEGASPTKLSDYGGVVEWADSDGEKVKEAKPLWVRGLPTPFDPQASEKRRERVQQSLADLGFDRALFESTVKTDGPLAEWHIRVRDLGAPAILQAIETTGNLTNTQEEIVAYLNLRPGTIVTRELRRRLERSLWNSARFTNHRVEVERLPDATGVRLKIHVQEYAHAPSLSTPFSREEKALMKHRHWMIHGAGSQKDFIVVARRAQSCLEVILSPVEGISSCWWKSGEPNAPPDFALVATDDDLAAYALSPRRKLAGTMADVQLNAAMTMAVNTGNPDRAFKVSFSFGFESLDDRQARTPLTLITSMPPVYFLAQVHEQAECSWQGTMLSVRSKRGTLRIDERTGELVEHSSLPSEVDDTVFEYSFRRQAFAQRRQEIIDATAGAANEFDGARPVSSVSAFFLDSGLLYTVAGFLYGEPFTARAPQPSLAVLGKMVDQGLLAIADTAVSAALEKDEESFKIPWQPDDAQEFKGKHYYGFLVAQAADRVFPRDSWAWTMWRESALIVTGLGQFAGMELNKLMSDVRCGPTSYWLLAELLNSIQRPVGPIAERGLSSFNRQAFIREWESALGSDLHPAVQATLQALRSLSDDDVVQLMALADGPQSAEWIRIAGQLRTATAPRADHNTTADLLEGIWSTDLRERLQQRLRQLATPARVSERAPNVER